MRPFAWLLHPRHRLDLVAGCCDGILTALTLASGRLLNAETPIDAGLGVATAATVSGGFILFFAHYAELRSELIHAERQLDLRSHGRLAATHLGHTALRKAVVGALIAGGCSFCGALLPLLLGAFMPRVSWSAIVVALGVLTLLGGVLDKAVHGSPFA